MAAVSEIDLPAHWRFLRNMSEFRAGRISTEGWHLLEGICPACTPVYAVARIRIIDQHGAVHLSPVGELTPGASLEAIVVVPAGGGEWSLTTTTQSPHSGLALGGFCLRPIRISEACRRMFSGASAAGGRPNAWRMLGVASQLLLPLLMGGTRAAGNRLVHIYQMALVDGADTQGMPACSVHSGVVNWFQACWQPINQLEAHAGADGGWEWTASGDDPQFLLVHRRLPVTLSPGWYEIDLEITPIAGRLLAPALYPDYGGGCAAHEMVPLAGPDEHGRSRTLIMFGAGVKRLRLDPSIRPLRFKMGCCQLRKLGRMRALHRLLENSGRRDGARDFRARARTIRTFVEDSFRHGLSTAASRLYGHGRGTCGADTNYADWVRLYDTQTPEDRLNLDARARQVEDGPLISVLLPVYQTPEHWLRRCLDSVLDQAYCHWELCVVDDASPSPRVLEILDDYARRDPRIRVSRRKENGHISQASNTALDMARGQYVALLDHDDELRSHALLEMAEAIVRNPGVGLLYSDEDKIDEEGRRFDPYFKPDWNPDLLYSQNFICHLSVIDTQLARHAGGFRSGFEGSQDHDLFLRCTSRLRPTQIHHVAKVLYHWRAVAGSTALERGAKDYASAAGARAVQAQLALEVPGAVVDESAHGHYRVRWPLPESPPKVSIIVPTRDRADLLRTCIESLLELTEYPDYEVVVVDNQSRDSEALDYLDSLSCRDRVRVLSFDAAFNYSAINNWAVAHCRGEVVCLLNNDIEIIAAGWLRELVSHAVRPGIGAVGPMLYYPDRTIQHAGVVLGLGGVANHIYAGQPTGHPGHGARALVAQNLSAVTGACLVVRREVYDQVNGLDERLQVAFNDIDFCLRLSEAGYRNVWTPYAELVHHESASRGTDETPDKRARFLGEVRYMEARWEHLLQCDPAYNRNLSLVDIDSGFSFPPR